MPPKTAATIVTRAIRARFFMLKTARKCTEFPSGAAVDAAQGGKCATPALPSVGVIISLQSLQILHGLQPVAE
jgi:hypothetical protein